MLGYGSETKAYQLYDIEQEKVVLSCDVIFNKSKKGIKKESVSKDLNSDHEVVQIECSNEDQNKNTEEDLESLQVEETY